MITINTVLHPNVEGIDLLFQPTKPSSLERSGCGICIGFFDGIHHGHQELLRRLVYHCAKKGLISTVFSFDDVPKLALRSQAEEGERQAFTPCAQLLQTAQQRRDLLEEAGVEYLFCQHFDAKLAALSGPDFLTKILLDALHVQLIVVGYDFRYGQKLKWGVAELKRWGEENNVEIIVVEPVLMYGAAIHSSRIRACLKKADLSRVQAFLGRPFAVRSRVQSGNQIGRTLSFPTANQVWPQQQMQPPFGVYATQTKVGDRLYRSMTSFGLRPTITETVKRPLLETHIFGFDGDLYGREIEVQFLHYLRAEQKFSDVKAMTEQLIKDAQNSEACFWQNERLQKWEVVNGRPIYILPSKRFRTGQVVVRMTLPQDQKNAARAVAVNYVSSVSQAYSTRLAFRDALTEMYGADFDAQTLQFGDLHDLVFQCSALTRTPDGQQPFLTVQSFLADTLLHPLFTPKKCWDQKIFQAERQNLCDELDAAVNHKAQYAWEKLKQSLFPNSILSEPPIGTKTALQQLSTAQVRQAWQDLWQVADIRVYLAGEVQEEWLTLWRDFLRQLPQPDDRTFYAVPGLSPAAQEMNHRFHQVEITEVEQSRINMVWQTDIPYNSLQSLVLQALNTVLGGESSSLLFNAVREERGLAYSIFSHSLATWEAWAVTAGVHPGRENEAIEAIETEILRFQTGGCRKEDYRKMLAILFTHLQTVPDRLSQLLNHCIRESMLGLNLSPQDREAMLREISLDDVVSLSKTLQLQAVHRLQNKEEEAVENDD